VCEREREREKERERERERERENCVCACSHHLTKPSPDSVTSPIFLLSYFLYTNPNLLQSLTLGVLLLRRFDYGRDIPKEVNHAGNFTKVQIFVIAKKGHMTTTCHGESDQGMIPYKNNNAWKSDFYIKRSVSKHASCLTV
jgi:hypothetical protein